MISISLTIEFRYTIPSIDKPIYVNHTNHYINNDGGIIMNKKTIPHPYKTGK
jgi:hypothetical protein